MFSRRALGNSWARFWVDFEGFGRGLGRVLGGFLESLEGQLLCFGWTAFLDFVFWLLVLLEGFGPKTRCLKISYVA